MENFNICLATDSYKIWHWKGYLPNTENNYGYLEARNGAKFNKTVCFGLQYILKKYLVGRVVTREKIEEAAAALKGHFGSEDYFNREGWEHILKNYGGCLPIRIKAAPEGTPVDVSNVLLTAELTVNDPKLSWLPNFLESMLLHVWYPMTVATLAYELRIMIRDYMKQTCDTLDSLPFHFHTFVHR